MTATGFIARASRRGLLLLDRFPWLLPLMAFTLAVSIAGVVHEAEIGDGFAYAKTVKVLQETGQYHRHDWYMPAFRLQAYWGLLFVKTLPWFFSSLRISMLVLAVVALGAFYGLARHFGLRRWEASLAALQLMACPMFCRFSFSFHTDISFLALTLLALWSYSAALSRRHVRLMLLASVFAAGSILVRQAGIALIPAVGAMWILRRHRVAHVPLFLSGLVLPLLAWLAPLLQPAQAESAADTFNHAAQTAYFQLPLLQHAREAFQRAGLAVIYLAAFAMPLALAAIPRLFRAVVVPKYVRLSSLTGPLSQAGKPDVLRSAAVQTACTFAAATALVLFAIGTTWTETGNWRFPYIVNSCFQPSWVRIFPGTQEAFTLLVAVASVAAIVIYRKELRDAVRRVERSSLLLLTAYSFFMLAILLVFLQFVDRYMLPMLPGLIIVLFRHCRRSIRRMWPLIAVGCLLWTTYQAEVLGRELRYRAAVWDAADRLLAAGVPAKEIRTPGWEWIAYHRFDEWVAEYRRRNAPREYYTGFYDWVDQQHQQGQYEVVGRIDGDRALNMPNVEVLERITVRTYLWKHGYVYVVRHLR